MVLKLYTPLTPQDRPSYPGVGVPLSSPWFFFDHYQVPLDVGVDDVISIVAQLATLLVFPEDDVLFPDQLPLSMYVCYPFNFPCLYVL